MIKVTESGGVEGFSPKHAPSQHCAVQVCYQTSSFKVSTLLNLLHVLKVGDSAIVITGGGTSPDGVKAFVTEYTGIQEGEVKNFFEDDNDDW